MARGSILIGRMCDCNRLSKDLMNLYEEVVLDSSECSKWSTFESFIKKHTWNYRCIFTTAVINMRETCSLKVCFSLLYKVHSLLRCGIALQIILKNVMLSIQVKVCEDRSSCIAKHFEGRLTYDQPSIIKLLVNYGFISTLKIRPSTFFDETHLMIACIMSGWTRHDFHATVVASKIMKVVKKSNFLSYMASTDSSQKGLNRLYLAAVAIRATRLSLEKENGLAEELIHNLKLYFAAMSHPFLTILEVRSLLYACFIVLQVEEFFDTYCEEFDKLMPECPDQLEPRSLTDLTRFQVRRSLGNCNLPLPTAVDQLSLPNTLKSFVLGDITNICRRSGNVPTRKTISKSLLAEMFCDIPDLQQLTNSACQIL